MISKTIFSKFKLWLLLILLLESFITIPVLSIQLNNQSKKRIRKMPLKVIYLASEGFLFSCSDKKVIVDALFDINVEEGLPPRLHDHLNSKQLLQLERGSSVFADIDLVLVTHHHDDHFTPCIVNRFLAYNKNANLVCPHTAESLLKRQTKNYEAYGSRVKVVNINKGQTESFKCKDIQIKVLGLVHAYSEYNRTDIASQPSYPHMAFYIQIQNFKIVHLGDAHVSVANFSPFKWIATQNIDVALVPYWFITKPEGLRIIGEYLNPEHVIVMHHHTGNRQEIKRRVINLKDKGWNLLMFCNYLQGKDF
jgi:L-ascorbate metabolism protein UlaG (beta-lactamase superfamily)